MNKEQANDFFKDRSREQELLGRRFFGKELSEIKRDIINQTAEARTNPDREKGDKVLEKLGQMETLRQQMLSIADEIEAMQ